MSYYRDLNKELIEQVQTMRMNMKLYCDEIVQLKGELMEKHETSVILRKECYNWAVENFIHLIETVQPDSDILPVLQKYVPPKERQTNNTTTTTSSRSLRTTSRTPPRISRISCGSGERSSGSLRRRSSQLTAEFLRSNSILNSRKSVCSTSPIRRSSSDTRDDEEEDEVMEEEEVEQNEEELEEEEPQNVDVEDEQQEQPEDSENVNENEEREEILNIIYEEDSEETEDEDDEVVPNNDDNNEESTYESVEEITVVDDTISTTRRSTLKDLTNMMLASSTQKSTLNESSPHKPIRKRGRPRKKNKTTNSLDQENNTTDSELELTVTDVRGRGGGAILHHTRATDQSETLQDARHCNDRHVSLRNKSIPIALASSNQSGEEATLASNSMSEYTDMTIGNFKDAACSTPNSRNNSLRKPAKPPTTITNNLATESESGSISDCSSTNRRPSRQCKPKNLAEPKIGSKLRNESKEKSLDTYRNLNKKNAKAKK